MGQYNYVCQLSDLNRVEEVLMLNFILKNTEIRAVPEECGHATVISITERNWYNYTVVGVTARYLRRRLSLSFLGMPCRPQHKESSLLTACDG